MVLEMTNYARLPDIVDIFYAGKFPSEGVLGCYFKMWKAP